MGLAGRPQWADKVGDGIIDFIVPGTKGDRVSYRVRRVSRRRRRKIAGWSSACSRCGAGHDGAWVGVGEEKRVESRGLGLGRF
jgi:hypothetical protein